MVPVSACSGCERIVVKISSTKWHANLQAAIQAGQNRRGNCEEVENGVVVRDFVKE